MLYSPMDVLQEFPVRKTKAQKQAFRDAVCQYARELEYPVCVEEGSMGARNVVIGDPNRAKYLLTAHYDTPARLLIPNLITPTNGLLFLLYQLVVTCYLIIPPLVLSLVALLLIYAPSGMEPNYFVCYVIYLVLLTASFALVCIGPANRSNTNDNTSGVVTLLEVLRTLPENQRHKVCFVLFDLEEAGLIGSASYRKAHKAATDSQLVLNLDCVGDGDHLRFFPNKKLKQDRKRLTSLYKACGYFGPKNILVHEKGFSFYPSDQKVFPYGVGICALNKGKAGLYLGRVHTSRDTVLDQTNVNLLRAALTTFISCDAAQ